MDTINKDKGTTSEIGFVFVDLDGSLIHTDLFVESILIFLKRNPLNFLRLLVWLFKGREVAKAMLARKVRIEPQHLPYEQELLDYLHDEKAKGRRLVLATASHRSYARRIARHLGIFDKVIASDAKHNLKGRRKLDRILEYSGNARFAYVGDSRADRPIWDMASSNIHVHSAKADIARSQSQGKLAKNIVAKTTVWRAFVREMRPHQWAKNLLVFVPLLTSHGYHDPHTLFAAFLAFFSFSLCASGGYFLNDLLDLTVDRRHIRKRLRPLASGILPIAWGVAGALGLPALAFIIAWLYLPLAFLSTLIAYFLITNAYSFYFKRISTADVIALAILYTLRIIAGACAINVALSSWLLAFSVFIFVSLAYLKRYVELAAREGAVEPTPGRGYSHADAETMFSLGISNATASVVVLALYINGSDEVSLLYSNSQILWLLCLLLLYWNNRTWVGARRGKIDDDPVVFAIKDRVSQLVGIASLLVVLAARYF